MTIVQAVVLGIVQGLGEFLPISSSAHLIAVPWIFGWEPHALSLDVALHFGTLLAVLAFFWRDWLELAKAGIRGARTFECKMFWFLALATVPGAAAGYFLEDYAETLFRNPLLICISLPAMGIILYLADRYGKRTVEFQKINLSKSFAIGLSQAAAIIPGVSRSGITMSAGRMLGLTREAAARYSFLLSTPIILGAAIFKASDIAHEPLNLPFIVGLAVSAVVGFASIRVLLKYLKKSNFNIFVVYRLGLAAVLLVLYMVRGG